MEKALIGYGGHAREVLAQMGKQLTCFVDDLYLDKETEKLKYLSNFDNKKYEVLIAIGDSNLRENILQKLPKNTQFFSFIHPTALILSQNIQLGVGCFIGAYSILTENIKIGNHSLLNRHNHIGHDCIIGDFLSMMPGSIISGNCKIGNNFYIGTNSSVREKIEICDDVKLGLNSAIIKNINKPGTYVGSPPKIIYEKN